MGFTGENPFHKRAASVRQQMGGNLNETDALNMARSAPPGQKNPFAANIQGPAPMPQLSDEEVDHRAFFDHTTPTFNFR
jgi:hypothetical protein